MTQKAVARSSVAEAHRWIRAALVEAADPRYRTQIERLVPGIRTIGVRVPRIRAIVAGFAKAHRAFDFASARALLDTCGASASRDEMLTGLFLVGRHKRVLPGLAWPRLAVWLKAVDNWEACDQLAMGVAAPCIAGNPALFAKLLGLTTNQNHWARRFAVATAAALNQKGRAMHEEALRVCEPLLADPEPMVEKAVTWAIREVSRKEPALALAFLRRHRAGLSLRTLRAAAAKLPAKDRAALLA
ncbi:MAG: DNA alkylation repair protein [Alphaproteobacteria bacterium]|nr:DNA alkylation repair protein [Alphaproteobacteria bacterium]